MAWHDGGLCHAVEEARSEVPGMHHIGLIEVEIADVMRISDDASGVRRGYHHTILKRIDGHLHREVGSSAVNPFSLFGHYLLRIIVLNRGLLR